MLLRRFVSACVVRIVHFLPNLHFHIMISAVHVKEEPLQRPVIIRHSLISNSFVSMVNPPCFRRTDILSP